MRSTVLLVVVVVAALAGCDESKPTSPDAGTTPVAPGPDASVPVMTDGPATLPATRAL